jgi:hypothetical protein
VVTPPHTHAPSLGTHLTPGVCVMGMQPPDGVLSGQGQLLLTERDTPLLGAEGSGSLPK